MRILFLHGWQSAPGGLKPTHLKAHGHEVLNPALDDEDFDAAVRVAQGEYDRGKPDVVVGSSRGGAVAMNIDRSDTPMVLMCPAWKRWGTATEVKPPVTILHSRADETIAFADSVELLKNSGLAESALVEVGTEHRLADPASLEAMLEACERSASVTDLVDVTVYYLEMRNPVQRLAPAPRDGLTVLHARTPTVAYYRFLYNAVGKDYHWLSRRKLSDAELAAVIGDPRNEVHVLHVNGSPAGFAELDRRQPDEIELVQFGLMAEFIGQGLGKWFLQWTIDKAWSYQSRRLWLHTCTLDHRAALPLYTKAGFVLFKQEAIRREL
ncbi:MAG: GNAT family N-acetyltransferase [Pirellulales bacterium]|nr:GNAT family N-acetyltransferase [Pirellulales bacterium]